MDTGEPWGQLICSTDATTGPVLIGKNKFVIGRAKGCDLSLSTNKLVSGSHCYIERDDDGTIKLCDTSTNGTLFNLKTKLSNGMSTSLTHGDEFHVVFKKGNESLRLGYVFQELAVLQDESFDNTQSYTDSEATLDYTPVMSENALSDEDTPAKRRKIETHTSQIPCSSKMAAEQDGSGASGNTNTKDGKDESKDETEKKAKDELPPKDDFEQTLMCMICQDILHDCISLQPCMHSFCSGCYSEWMERSSECPTCRLKVERINKNHMVNNLVEAYLNKNPDKKRTEEDLKELDAKNKITRDMLYPKKNKRRDYYGSDDDDSYNSDGSDGSLVEIVLPNVASSGVFRFGTALVSATPHNRHVFGPPRTTCRQCPNYNTLLANTGQPTPGTGTARPSQPNPAPSAASQPTPNTSNTAQTSNTPTTTTANTTPGTSTSQQPSTSATTSAPTTTAAASTAPDFICGPRQNHVMCQCCYQPMPDRRHERPTNTNLPQTTCCICWRSFCHLYWGCRRPGCLGCLAKFKDFNFNDRDLAKVLIENEFETNILKEYVQSKSKTFKDVLEECCAKLDSKAYKCIDQTRGLQSSNAVICYTCALKNFRELVYQYRKDVPADDLSDEAQSRGDCYWGKNCRTAKNKPHHAKNFNHICEQTRFT